jgi:hypothetical protein
MKFLDRILHRTTPTAPPAPQASATCLHVSLVPAWDDPADMGREEKASKFTCAACRQQFTPEEARALRQTEADRLRQLSAGSAVAEAEPSAHGVSVMTPAATQPGGQRSALDPTGEHDPQALAEAARRVGTAHTEFTDPAGGSQDGPQ